MKWSKCSIKRKILVVNAHIKKKKNSINLTLHFKKLKKDKLSLKLTEENRKIRAEIDKIEKRHIIERLKN